MRLTVTAAAMAFVVSGASQAVAQETAGTSAPAPTPEAAAKFIDSVLGSGVILRAALLSDYNSFSGAIKVEGSRTQNCKTVIFSPVREDLNDRWRLEIDWRKFASANSFFPPEVKDRWIVRIVAPTAENLAEKDNLDALKPNYETKRSIGAAVEPGTEQLKDRLIRAVDFYGKSCAPKMDGPF